MIKLKRSMEASHRRYAADCIRISEDGRLVGLIDIERSVPFPIFRYTKHTRFLEFKKTGRLFFNTLRSFNDEERLGNRVGDRNEGVLYYRTGDGQNAGEDVQTFVYGDSPNGWIQCYSLNWRPELMEEFGADCCFEIASPRFFEEVAKAVVKAGGTFCALVGLVEYLDACDVVRKTLDTLGTDKTRIEQLISFTKSTNYADQKEVRILIEPLDGKFKPADHESADFNWEDPYLNLLRPSAAPNLLPLTIDVPSARRYVRLVQRKPN